MALFRSVELVEAEVMYIHIILFCYLDPSVGVFASIGSACVVKTHRIKRIGYDAERSKRHCIEIKCYSVNKIKRIY